MSPWTFMYCMHVFFHINVLKTLQGIENCRFSDGLLADSSFYAAAQHVNSEGPGSPSHPLKVLQCQNLCLLPSDIKGGKNHRLNRSCTAEHCQLICLCWW